MAIVKFVSSGCPMNNIFQYVMRDEATEQRLIDGINCSPDTALEEFRYVKQKYGKEDGRTYSPERYDVMAGGYEQEQEELKEKLLYITKRLSEMDMRDQCIKEFMAKAREYVEMPKLTPELLRVFIRRIDVYEKLEKYSRTCGNPVVIHYSFQLPEQNGMPAIEPLIRTAAKSA